MRARPQQPNPFSSVVVNEGHEQLIPFIGQVAQAAAEKRVSGNFTLG